MIEKPKLIDEAWSAEDSDPNTIAGLICVGRRFSMLGHRALVTGGSVSIGRAIAIAFADAGADVAIQYAKNADEELGVAGSAEATAQMIRTRGRKVALIPADFSHPGEGRRAVAEAANAIGSLDTLVLAASIQYRKPFDEVVPEEIDRQVQVNFCATIEILQSALPAMRERGFGRILLIGSVNQTRPEPELSVYGALKSAQANLALNLARQFGPFGVTVNNLSPGLVATERNRWRRQDADAWAEIERNSSPLGRAGTPEEIVGAALLLCSAAGSFINGADLQVTGGRHL
jgi:NAD(P)-dependent dehydrogenase (short-subunit alcohol dehydrogenase family)